MDSSAKTLESRNNPSSEHYDLGSYRDFRFNSRDLMIRQHLELYAEEFFSKEELPEVLRNLSESEENDRFLITRAYEVLSGPNDKKNKLRFDDLVLYLPIERLHPDFQRSPSQPKCTEFGSSKHTGKLEKLERIEDSGSPNDYDCA